MPARAVVLEQATAAIDEGDDYLEGGSPSIITSTTPSLDELDPDTLSSDSLVGSGQIIATADLTGDDDTISVSGTLTSNNVEATAAITDDADTLTSAGEIGFFHATLAITEANDTLVAANQLTTHGAFTLTENTDVITSAAQILGTAPIVNATVSLLDASDTVDSHVLGQNVIAGVAVGQIGSGNLSNYKLIMGDDFDFPILFHGNTDAQKGGRRYGSHHFNGDREERAPLPQTYQFQPEPSYRGVRSEVPDGINVTVTTVANSMATMTIGAPTDPTLIANLPTTYNVPGGKPPMMTGELNTWSWFTWSAQADYVAEAVFEVEADLTVGLSGGPWDTSVVSWPDHGEWDFGEFTENITTAVRIGDYGLHISDVDGGGNVGGLIGEYNLPSNRPIWVRMIKTGTQLQQWDDVASQGTLALRYTYTNSARVARIRGAHNIRMSSYVYTSWRGGSFNAAQGWPTTIKYHWWRVWGPSGGKDWVAPIDLGVTQVAPGGSWAWTLPSPTTLYGSVPSYEEWCYVADGLDCPGIATRNTVLQYSPGTTPPVNYRLAGGQTYNPATRAIGGTVPSTEGGRIGILMLGSFSTGGAARIAIKWWDVAPAAQASLLASLTLTPGIAVNATVAQKDFHSGNLGPHTYVASFTSGGNGLTIGYGAGASTVTITGTPTTSNDAIIRVTATNAKGQSNSVDHTIVNSATVAIGGIAIGTAGTGTLAGLKLVAGDDFDVLPTWWHPVANRAGRYHTNAGRANQTWQNTDNPRTPYPSDSSIYMDPYYRGYRSASPTPLGIEPLSVSASVLTLNCAALSAPNAAWMPPFYTANTIGDANAHPRLSAARMWTDGYFLLGADGDFCIEAKIQFDSRLATGYWAGFWVCGIMWPQGHETDMFEVANNSNDTQIRETTTVSTSLDDTQNVMYNSTAIYANHQLTALDRMVWVRLIKTGSTISIYTDETVAGTLALKGTETSARIADRIHRANHICPQEITCNLTSWGRNGTFNAGHWPRTSKIDWWRCWTPASQPDHVPHTYLTDIDIDPGGSWAMTLPSAATLYGSTPDFEEYMFTAYSMDEPGYDNYTPYTYRPGGMSIDLSTRAITGTNHGLYGGRASVFFAGTWAAGGPARVAVQCWNVAPAAQATLFADRDVIDSTAVLINLAYTDFHSGNLGDHTYTVTKVSGGTDFTITMGSGNHSATIEGTVTTVEDTTIRIVCENAIGQTTTVDRVLTWAAASANIYNFSGSGGVPTGWSQKWVTTGITITEGSGFMRSVTTVNGRHGIQWDTPGTSITDVEILVKIRCNVHADPMTAPFIFVRGSGAAGSENCYRCGLGYSTASGTGFIGTTKVVAGVSTYHTVYPVVAWAANQWMWLRMRANGTSISVKGWADGSSEPGTWGMTWTDSAVASGSIGTMPFDAGQTVDIDYFSYALAGATAP